MKKVSIILSVLAFTQLTGCACVVYDAVSDKEPNPWLCPGYTAIKSAFKKAPEPEQSKVTLDKQPELALSEPVTKTPDIKTPAVSTPDISINKAVSTKRGIKKTNSQKLGDSKNENTN